VYYGLRISLFNPFCNENPLSALYRADFEFVARYYFLLYQL
jgi:hypothetical protein